MSTFKDNLYAVRRDPSLMENLIYRELDRQMNPIEGMNEYDIPDGSLPFVFAVECGITETVAAMDEMYLTSRQMYPRQALNNEDLYRHMADDDYIGRFAEPAFTTFELLLGYDEVIAKVKPIPGSDVKKLTIPRLTEFTVGDLHFTMQYPIDIKVMRHGGLQIEYVLDRASPVQVLRTNIVAWSIGKISNQSILKLSIPVQQFMVTTHTDSLSNSTLFQSVYPFADQFFYARAYMDYGSDEWTELKTTHSDLTYDPSSLTIVFKVVDNKLHVSIPTIYTTSGMVSGNIRIDIYTTKGRIDRELSNYRPDQFTLKLNSIDDPITYTSPLSTFSLIQSISDKRVDGGAPAVPFVELRQRVIDNTFGNSQLPITNLQLEGAVRRLGYELVSNIDNITNRQFIASRRLETPTGLNLVSAAGSIMSQLKVSMESLGGSVHCSDNGNRLTIKPSMLYRFKNGIVNPMADTEIANLVNADSEQIAREANANRLVYSPFHTVLDTTRGNFDVRPYYLDSPTIIEKTFVMENDSAGLQVAIADFDIIRIPTGYRITVGLESSAEFKKLNDSQVILQIGYQPPGESRWCSVNGRLQGLLNEERVFTFDIETNFDINSESLLQTTNLSMYTEAQNKFVTGLLTNFDVTVIVGDSVSPDYEPNELDQMVQTHLLPLQFMTVVRERLETRLGYNMTKLWRRSRPVLGEEDYLRWTENVPKYYTEDVYLKDTLGNIVITIGATGEIEYTVLHRKGDPELDANGGQIYEHLKGDVKTDPVTGKPILVEPRKRLYELTMFMLDGIFYFVTDRGMSNYRDSIPLELVSWLEGDINYLDQQLLEECEMSLYPTTTFGDAVAAVREGQRSSITLDQTLAVTFYLTPVTYTNSTIRPNLIKNSKEIINNYLARDSVSISDIISRLKESSGEGVVGIEVSGLGGPNNFSVLTLEDDSVRLSLRKKLTVMANQELTVEDDIQFNFLKHEVLQV